MIEQYFKSLLDLIEALPFVQNPAIHLEKRAETIGFIRGDIEFKDRSLLHFRELIDLRHPLRIMMYAYHYQKPGGTLVFRYDNTPHHMSVSTFPHHKHTADGNISPTSEMGLEAVLREVEALINLTEDE